MLPDSQGCWGMEELWQIRSEELTFNYPLTVKGLSKGPATYLKK